MPSEHLALQRPGGGMFIEEMFTQKRRQIEKKVKKIRNRKLF
jgi:hypothetical protein